MIRDSCPHCGSKFIADLSTEYEYIRSSTEKRMHDVWLSRHRTCLDYTPTAALLPSPTSEARA